MSHLVRLLAALLLVALMATVATGCGADPEEEAVKQVLEDQVKYLRNEDLEGVMLTIHPESPLYAQTRDQLKIVFEQFDLEYDLDDVEVVEMSDNQAKVRAVRTTRKLSGPEGIKDTRKTELYTLRKSESGWGVYESQTESTENLVSNGG